MADLPTGTEPLSLCYTKTRWSESWTERSLLVPTSIVSAAAPSHSSAMLRHRYGITQQPPTGTRPADTGPTVVARPDLIGHYLKIVVEGFGTWYGLIPDAAGDRHGVDAQGVEHGVETYTAYGLTWLLENCQPVLQSKCLQDGAPVTINRAIPFNGGTDGRSAADRISTGNFDSGQRVFTDIFETTKPERWKARDAIKYLLQEFPPKGLGGTQPIRFELDQQAEQFLNYELPFTPYEGLTLWQILGQMIDRRRGLGWNAYVDEQAQTVKISVWSQNVQPVLLPSGNGTIPGNPNTTTLNFDSAVNIHSADIVETQLAQYHQVLVFGGRCGSVFSVRPDTNMDSDWSTADQTEYDDGATGETGFSSLSDPEKEAANNDVRAQDKLAHVYSWWRLDPEWNGRADTEPSDSSHNFAFPRLDEDGEPDFTQPAIVQRSGLRFQPFLPMRPQVDYTGTVDPETALDDDRNQDFLAPALFLQVDPVNEDVSANDDGWVHAERLNQSVDSGSTAREYKYSLDVRVRTDAPGLIFQTTGGTPQHFIAEDLFTPDGTYESIPEGEGIDHDSWLATVYMLQDDYVRTAYPLRNDLPAVDVLKVLVLRLPDARLDFLVPKTAVGIAAGELLLSGTGWGILRDDRDQLKDIARLAFEFYGTSRTALHLTYRELVAGFSLGTLITTIGSGSAQREVNTCITQVEYDLINGETKLVTGFGELDFTAAGVGI